MAQTKRERLRMKNGRRESGEYLTTFQVANLLGLSPWALTVWRRQRKGPPFLRLGKNTIRYPGVRLQAWLRALGHKTKENRNAKFQDSDFQSCEFR